MKRMLKVGDILGRGDSRLVVVDVKIVRVSRVGTTNMGVVYTVQQHDPVNGCVIDGNAYTMIGGTEIRDRLHGESNSKELRTVRGAEVRTTRSALKMGGWKLVAGPTFNAREEARKAAEVEAADEAAGRTVFGKSA